jgi:hypothetical protein
MGEQPAYYWAQGKKVSLQQATEIAVDVPAAQRAGLWEGELSATADRSGARLSADLALLPAAEVPEPLRDRLESAGAVQPVFRHDDALLVVLPEVRVETEDPGTAAALRSAVDTWTSKVDMEQPTPGRYVLRPASHRGEDALDLANFVSETVKPEAAQARFVRVVPDTRDTAPGNDG